jgi:hypothetical protein
MDLVTVDDRAPRLLSSLVQAAGLSHASGLNQI